MRIAFTGHRDRFVQPHLLRELARRFPQAVWVHGGATGFDSQVAQAARECGIEEEVVAPDYATYLRRAPLMRNLQILAGADLLVACYDGRKTGGTAFTVRRALKLGVTTVVWHPGRSMRAAAR